MDRGKEMIIINSIFTFVERWRIERILITFIFAAMILSDSELRTD
jgi:hypothetical protein